MAVGAQMLLGMVLLSPQGGDTPNVHLVGRPTTFDYYRSPTAQSAWIDAVIYEIDTRGGMLTVRNRLSGRPTTLTFPAQDRGDVLKHRVGDKIKIEIFQDLGGVRARHRDCTP